MGWGVMTTSWSVGTEQVKAETEALMTEGIGS